MNASELYEYDNATFISRPKQSFERYDVINTQPIISKVVYVIFCVILALGIPGNVLSAIVWLRRYVADKNSSALYLAVLAINDLVLLISEGFMRFFYVGFPCSTLFCHCIHYPRGCALLLEPLLVLAFSIERLIAVIRPMQVCRLTYKPLGS